MQVKSELLTKNVELCKCLQAEILAESGVACPASQVLLIVLRR